MIERILRAKKYNCKLCNQLILYANKYEYDIVDIMDTVYITICHSTQCLQTSMIANYGINCMQTNLALSTYYVV